jgi:hypothetical protein
MTPKGATRRPDEYLQRRASSNLLISRAFGVMCFWMQGCREGEESGHDQKTTEICGNEPEISSRFRRGKDMARWLHWHLPVRSP